MDKNNILQFEADDTSKTGINGKQVFFAKRINGKMARLQEIKKLNERVNLFLIKIKRMMMNCLSNLKM